MKLTIQNTHSGQAATSVNGARAFIKSHRSGLTTGAFVFTGVVVLAAGSAAVSDSHTSSQASAAPTPPASSLQVDTQSTGNSSADAAVGSNLSTNIQSTNDNGAVSTNVTVNGQPVEVPQNGTKTVTTPDGTATITTNSSQSTNGTARNFNYSFTSTSVSNDSSN
jgi:hypothetical protein